MKHYAQINPETHQCEAHLITNGEATDMPNMIEVAPGENRIGQIYNASTGQWSDPPPPPPPPPPVWEWYIDKGSFFDRFGTAKLPVLMCTDGVVKALLADINSRQWIDLKKEDVAQALGYVASQVPQLTPELMQHILTTPVAEQENLALRKLFFSS